MSRTRRRFLGDAALAILPAVLPPMRVTRVPGRDGDGPRRRPNVLFVFSDSHRASSLGCYGDAQLRTPVLDGLAAEGARYEACVSNTPQCRPYRASLMSGSLAHHTGVLAQKSDVNFGLEGRQWNPRELPLLGETFAAAGYRCGYIGKWHLGDPQVGPGPLRFGFDDGWWIATDPHDYTDVTYYTGKSDVFTAQGRFRPSAETGLAADFIRESAAPGADGAEPPPWLLMVSWGPPHSPFEPPNRWRIDEPRTPLPNVPPEVRDEIQDALLPRYDGLIEAIDELFARLLKVLGNLGLAEDTIVVYTSDHGQLLGSHGQIGKNVPWSESSRVPMIVRWPGVVPPGTELHEPFGTPDILPSLCGLAGLEVPTGIDGVDLSGPLRGEDETADRAAYLTGHDLRDFAPSWKGLRTSRYLYARSQAAPWLLYDLAEDPYELNNLVGQDEALTKTLDERTRALMTELGDVWR